MSVEISLDGKCAVITGGGGGIGAAIAEEFARAGARVVVADIDADAAVRVAERIAIARGAAEGRQVDVTDPESVDRLFDHCIEQYGGVDIFVASAGLSDKGDIFELELDEWRTIMDVNLTGSFLCAKRATKSMRDNGRGGRILLIGSPTGFRGALRGHVAYAASKGGLFAFAKSLARTVAVDKITVNVITPGQTDTELLWKTNPREAIEKIMETVPLGLAKPSDVAAGALYLASDGAKHVTGISLDIDGGGVMR
ncbi:dehydrogenase of unknown specificity, short-chain alcohol dehydrogenase like [Hoeflea sp. IMCC20628]|uniref:SDR family NAD(P)-dependent oxidoreductase n=1 Tax=Hoeflea sp. IMCC20628 TaxID=1620421 RepID=UPI00063AACDA|nr:SDR family NAD(P)-dependent oxidoreductase [Hoeflea sp. IMCC20628]AKH99701.1 dehydrogenase of unknown specificity, short-chain alcohol dehydrogenase like [Hoeflea sp. IMCC20628]